MRPTAPQARRAVLGWLACVGVAALVSTPIALEQAVERARFEDRLGTLPVEVALAHDGVTTLDSGVLGKLYWRRTGPGGFGAHLRSTGPPLADGTLASYVSPTFLQANASFVDHPREVAAAYGGELRHQVVVRTLQYAVVGGVVGGTVLLLVLRGGPPLWGGSRRRRWVVGSAVTAGGVLLAVGVGAVQFHHWSGSDPTVDAYPLPGRAELLFSSPQTREIAQQIGPFIEKNTSRIETDARNYEAAADASIAEAVPSAVERLRPRDGEVVVLAEADPQGSRVGTRVRRSLYAVLRDQLGDGALVLRTVAGDISSNGTVAERGFVRGEASASGDLPVVFAKGDHDTDATVDQLLDANVPVPDTEVVDAGGLRVASARDPAFKALFGGLVVSDADQTEQELGRALRARVDEDVDDREPVVVVLHQPNAVAGYLGLDTPSRDTATLDEFRTRDPSLTTPVDDGIPDLPPGIVTYGHLHDPAGPWVVWNTDTDDVTWTVVTQLGTSGGVEENPTFNRFSTPFSAPLKTIDVQLQYVDPDSGLQTGYVEVAIATDGTVTVADRVDLGLPAAG